MSLPDWSSSSARIRRSGVRTVLSTWKAASGCFENRLMPMTRP
jgi:hypothetical protein